MSVPTKDEIVKVLIAAKRDLGEFLGKAADGTDSVSEINALIARLQEPEPKTGIRLIASMRKKLAENLNEEQEDRHGPAILARAAVSYALSPKSEDRLRYWPFMTQDFRPSPNNRIKELQIAGAYCAATIDNLIRHPQKVVKK